MKKLILFFISLIIFGNSTYSQQKVYTADIEGDIDLGLAPFIKRVVEDAEENFGCVYGAGYGSFLHRV